MESKHNFSFLKKLYFSLKCTFYLLNKDTLNFIDFMQSINFKIKKENFYQALLFYYTYNCCYNSKSLNFIQSSLYKKYLYFKKIEFNFKLGV